MNGAYHMYRYFYTLDESLSTRLKNFYNSIDFPDEVKVDKTTFPTKDNN